MDFLNFMLVIQSNGLSMQIILYQIVFCLHYLYKWDPLATDKGSACFYFQSFVAVPFKSCDVTSAEISDWTVLRLEYCTYRRPPTLMYGAKDFCDLTHRKSQKEFTNDSQ